MCETDCQGEDRPRFHAEPSDAAHNDGVVRELYWYHSSTHANWPNRSFDSLAELTDETKQRMNRMLPPGGLDRWAKKQKSKALHVAGRHSSRASCAVRRWEPDPVSRTVLVC